MPARKRITLVVDVNVLVSMLINQDTIGIKGLFNKQVFRVVVSPSHLAELEDVLGRPKFRRYFTMREAERALERIRKRSHSVKTEFQVRPICRDPKDDYLLALAKAAKADLLVTGDEDVLVLKKYGKTRIMKPAEFRKKYL